MNISVGMGFSISQDDENLYGVITHFDESDKRVYYCYVKQLYNQCGIRTLCYNDDNASYAEHKDNVLLQDCPPPFSELCDMVGNETTNRAYAIADMGDLKGMHVSVFEQIAKISDNGQPISNRDLNEIYHHDYYENKELEKTRKGNTSEKGKAAARYLAELNASESISEADFDITKRF